MVMYDWAVDFEIVTSILFADDHLWRSFFFPCFRDNNITKPTRASVPRFASALHNSDIQHL